MPLGEAVRGGEPASRSRRPPAVRQPPAAVPPLSPPPAASRPVMLLQEEAQGVPGAPQAQSNLLLVQAHTPIHSLHGQPPCPPFRSNLWSLRLPHYCPRAAGPAALLGRCGARGLDGLQLSGRADLDRPEQVVKLLAIPRCASPRFEPAPHPFPRIVTSRAELYCPRVTCCRSNGQALAVAASTAALGRRQLTVKGGWQSRVDGGRRAERPAGCDARANACLWGSLV